MQDRSKETNDTESSLHSVCTLWRNLHCPELQVRLECDRGRRRGHGRELQVRLDRGPDRGRQLTGSDYWALIGFWQPELATGVREQAYSPSGRLLTRLYSPFPTPAVRSVTMRYSLAGEGSVTLRVHDLTGRVVRTLCASCMKRGAYSVTWNGTDDRGRSRANGVYFVRMMAGDYRATEKVVLQK
jgi:hypothetical protein